VFSAPTSDVSPAPSSSLPKELIVKIEKVSGKIFLFFEIKEENLKF